jgi:hypothetical protein
MWYAKLYENDTMVRYFIPCIKIVNGVSTAGMLDCVNLQWYGNENNTGSFAITEA